MYGIVMGSDDNTDGTNPMLRVQDPEGSSAAKTTSSDGSGGADGSGASRPSSPRHQPEQVQNLKGECEVVVDVPMEPEDDLIAKTNVPDKEPDITSVAWMRIGRAEPTTPSHSSGGEDGRRASYQWSLTEWEQVRNLKRNWGRAFGYAYENFGIELAEILDSQRFARVVAKLREDPYPSNSEIIEIIDTEARESWDLEKASPLHFAVLMGDLQMVQKILETRSVSKEVNIDSTIAVWAYKYSALDFAIVGGESEIVDALLRKNAKVDTCSFSGSLQLAVVSARKGQTEKTSKIIQLLLDKGTDINSKDVAGFSAFFLAVVKGKTDIVKELLRWKDKIQLNEEGWLGQPPIQFANEQGFKDIESELMKCDEVKGYIESAFRDRQAYVDAANAILVGAALIASVTFASWLQPPLNYTTSYHSSSLEYVDVEHNIALGSFWVFNTLSFYFAIGTVVFGAHSVLPRRQLFITENVKKLSQNLILTSILLAFSVLFVIVAFGIAGIIVLIPILRYRWYMIAPMILGGLVCVGSIGYLFKSIWENMPWNIRNRKKNRRTNLESNYIDNWYGFRNDVDESDSE